MCYSHVGNEVCNRAISITQRGFINDCYKVNPVGRWGKFLLMAMGFVDHLGQCRLTILKFLPHPVLFFHVMNQKIALGKFV